MTADVPVSGSTITLYPCDRGTGSPMGWHHFLPTFTIDAPFGCCVYCGARPDGTRP